MNDKHFIIIYGLVQLRIVPVSISGDNMNHVPNTTDIQLFPFLASVALALHQRMHKKLPTYTAVFVPKPHETRCHNILHSFHTTGERSGYDNM